MNDYRTKRRFRQQKLTNEGFYERRQQQSRVRRRAQQATVGGLPSCEQIFAPENLIGIYDKLQHNAGNAPGPDQITYRMLGRREICQIMRQLSADILNGTYEPSTARSVRIPKANGRGDRTLSLRSILYRIAAAALADALGPCFDEMFLPGSYGFRPGRGTATMLIEMERIILEQQRFVIAQDDIRNAFDQVRIEYVMQLLSNYIHDERLLIISNSILSGHDSERRTVGIDQGSALSPLMLNVALHHTLDVPLSEHAVHPPWLRYADNLIYLCQSVHEGTTAIQAAQDYLNPIGMALKGTDGPPVDLLQGQQANILGFSIRWDNDQLNYDLTDEAWTSLKVSLSATHTNSSPEVALQAAKGWIDAGGPAFEGKLETPILKRILEVAAEAGYRELSQRQLKRYFQSSRDRWANRKRNARIVFRGITDQEGEVAPLTTDRTGHLDMPEARSLQVMPAAVLAPY